MLSRAGGGELRRESSKSSGSDTDHQRRHTLTNVPPGLVRVLEAQDERIREASRFYGAGGVLDSCIRRSSRAGSISFYKLYRVFSPELVPCYTLLCTL
jgi:hypothetical protein